MFLLQEFQAHQLWTISLDEYLDSVLLLEDREEMITFTEKIYTKIDSLPGVKKELLKGMVSIALCSINLWVPV